MNNKMELIQPADYGRLAEKLHEIPYNTLFARSVLEWKANGYVWADNRDNPETLYIAHEYGMSLLLGHTENEDFNASLVDYMLNPTKDRQRPEWLQVYPGNWNAKLMEITKGKIINYSTLPAEYSPTELDRQLQHLRKDHIIQWQRVNFTYHHSNPTVPIAPGYTIKFIDSGIWERIEGTVIPTYFWKTKEDFLLNGIGYALMNGNDIVSIAFSVFLLENQLEIGIETSERYRGMGLAKLVCRELLTYCRNNGYIPVWACRKENTGSYRLAKSLGFKESLTLPYYELVR